MSIERSVVKSFSAGELSDWIDAAGAPGPVSLNERYGDSILNQYRFIKVGLASMATRSNWQNSWQVLFRFLPLNTDAVAVSYLDYPGCHAPAPEEIIEFAATQDRCAVILFDTYQKSGNLFSHLSERRLKELITMTHRHNLISVVAGSVDEQCLSQVRQAAPNFIGVRGAVCPKDRTAEIDGDLVRKFLAYPHRDVDRQVRQI
jgi:uncharacterized protein (UPF0264 family)